MCYTGLSTTISAVEIPVERNVLGIIIERRLPKRMTSSRYPSLASTSFSNSALSSGTGTGPSIETAPQLGETEVIFDDEGTIGSTVIAIKGSLPGYTEG